MACKPNQSNRERTSNIFVQYIYKLLLLYLNQGLHEQSWIPLPEDLPYLLFLVSMAANSLTRIARIVSLGFIIANNQSKQQK